MDQQKNATILKPSKHQTAKNKYLTRNYITYS